MTKEEYNKLIAEGNNFQKQAHKELVKLLTEHGAVEFNYEVDAPSIVSRQFDADVTDCCVKKLSSNGVCVYADLHSYYLEEDAENVDITENQYCVDWLDLLDWVVSKVL